MVNRPNRTQGYPPEAGGPQPVVLQANTPGIEAVDFDLVPEPFCLTENGEEPRPTPAPSQTPTITPVPSPTATPPAFTRSLSLASPAMRGEDVYAVQARLLALGYTEVGTPDGTFGKLTDQAVRRFQKRNGLEVDGVVGPLTWEKLFSAEAIGAK
jgi:peptidoglycan hydrolase-like protein with peptidoglycan-binding domain